MEHLVFMCGAVCAEEGGPGRPFRHKVLTSLHRSPLSAHRGFIGKRAFFCGNSYLQEQGRQRLTGVCRRGSLRIIG